MNLAKLSQSLTDDERVLLARAAESAAKASSGAFASTSFLSPRERAVLECFGYSAPDACFADFQENGADALDSASGKYSAESRENGADANYSTSSEHSANAGASRENFSAGSDGAPQTRYDDHGLNGTQASPRGGASRNASLNDSENRESTSEKPLGRLSELASKDYLPFYFGGWRDAERRIFCAVPGFSLYSLDGCEDDPLIFADDLAKAASEQLTELVTPLFIRASGYVSLSHRDYMGALLGLGIERSVVGDIVLTDGGAVVFAAKKIAGFIKNSLEQIGRDKVRVEEIGFGSLRLPRRSFEKVTGTIASARLDAVVSELASASRDGAKELIRRGFVEHNYFTASESDAPVHSGDVISIRRDGKIKGGKFRIKDISELTQKGRIRLAAEKYTS